MLLSSSAVRVLVAMALGSLCLGCGEEDAPTRVRNDSPSPCFSVSPTSGTTETDFTFDAGCSRDAQDSTAALRIRWDWENDGAWNSEWSATKTVTRRFETAGTAIVRMEIRDSGDLTAAVLDTIDIGAPNQPPAACFTLNVTRGTAETAFAVDASCTTDNEDGVDSLRVRWDWENDGRWDTGWTPDKAAEHRYSTIGQKTIRMETLDKGGRTDEALDSLEVLVDYLGQTPPGLMPQVFPPPALRATYGWTWHGSPSFSPNGREMFFTRYVHAPPEHSQLLFTRLESGQWSLPQAPPFGDVSCFQNNPWYSASGDTLYYVTGRPGEFISCVTRAADGWSAPVPLPIVIPEGATPGLHFCFSRKGTLYAELGVSGDADIYRWERRGDGYVAAEKLAGTINSSSPEFSPFVDPEEGFLLFSSQRPGGFGRSDIYISRRLEGGGWAEAVNLGPLVNSPADEGWPWISPDGRYLFFVSPRGPGSRGYEPLWVDVHFLDGLTS